MNITFFNILQKIAKIKYQTFCYNYNPNEYIEKLTQQFTINKNDTNLDDSNHNNEPFYITDLTASKITINNIICEMKRLINNNNNNIPKFRIKFLSLIILIMKSSA